METGSEMSVGELARATDTKPVTIRWYEKVGLLPNPPRTAGNYRAYGAAHLGRLRFIRRSRELGFSIEEIRALLQISDDSERDCADVDMIARHRLADVERKIADLTSLAGELRHVIGQCHGGTIAECRIIEALAPRT